MVLWPPSETRLSQEGYEFITNPPRPKGDNISDDYWRMLTKIYFRLHTQINAYCDLWEWFDPIFCDSFIAWDLERQDNHLYKYRQRWRATVGQKFRVEGSQKANPFCTGGRPAGQLGGEWIPLTVIVEEREDLIQQTAQYVTGIGEDGACEEYITPFLPLSDLPTDGETMFRRSNSPEGWIYVLTHPSFEGWVKIGKTRNLTNRLRSYNTGAPIPEYHYVIERHFPEGDVPHPDALGIEQFIHQSLRAERNNEGQNREWYEFSIDEAVGQIEGMVNYLTDEEGETSFEELNDAAELAEAQYDE
jgi:hypothetical protein